jgi:zinc protease
MDFKQTQYPGLPQMLNSAFVAGGLKQGSQTALNRCFSGKNINLNFYVDEESYVFHCRTDRTNLNRQLELIGAYLVEPGYRTEGEELFRKNLPLYFQYSMHKPDGVVHSAVQEFLSNGDTRYFFPPIEVMEKRNFVEAAAVLHNVFERQYMEITIVGDFNRDALMQQLFATFGQLPFREKKKQIPQNSGNSYWPNPQTKIFHFPSGIDKAVAYVVWPIEPSEEPNETAKINVLCSILQNRLIKNIREKNANTYAPFASFYITEAIGRGCIKALVTTSSDNLKAIGEQVMQLADDMAQDGITQDELDRAVKPLISSLEKKRVTNDFWMECLKNAQARPEKLRWHLADESRYKRITIKDIQSIAKLYLRHTSAICMLIKPTLEQKTEEAVTLNNKDR